MKDEVGEYTGITKQANEARLYQYRRNGKDLDRLDTQHENLTRNQARAIEQYFIDEGPNKQNKIRSIAKENKYYKAARAWVKNI